MSGPEHNPMDDEPIDREQWEAAMENYGKRADDECRAVEPKTRLCCTLTRAQHGAEHRSMSGIYCASRWPGKFQVHK